MTFNDYLLSSFTGYKNCTLKDAMLYALEGGKRVRPQLIFALLKDFGYSEEVGYPAALALEMVHAYSLVHDDLPCMDNDNYRRGKLTVHKAFGEDIAILAGDGLLTHAFGAIAGSSYAAEIKAYLIKELSSLAGMNGMLYGQFLDITNTLNTVDESLLAKIEDYKTGALFKCALLMGMYIVKDNIHQSFYENLSLNIGRAFQLQDDLFEIIKSQKETGKEASDLRNNKATGVSLYNLEVLQDKINKIFIDLHTLLNNAHFKTSNINEYVYKLERR